MMSGILLLAVFVFSFVLKNDFINWDDPEYILQNQSIRDFSLEGIFYIFSTLHFNGYLPVTIFSYAVDYIFWKNNPMGYHLTNLILHLLNTYLVFVLSKKLIKSDYASLFVALFFAVHPMRVESVAWAAERKDVLFAFFYLLSLISYVNYLSHSFKTKHLIFCFLFFLLSVLSKWSAFPLAFILLLLDYFHDRKIGIKAILEKFLFLVIPVLSVLLHLSKGAIVVERFDFLHRAFMGSYAFLFYLFKFLFPIHLSALYPYPKLVDGMLPLEYYLALPAVLTLIVILILAIRKNIRHRKIIVLCFGFFAINIGMVLHVLSPIGGIVVVAERYTYIPYFGLFLFVGYVADKTIIKFPKRKKIITMFVLLLATYCCFITNQRNKIWKNSTTFFNEILNNDSTIAFAWNNLGYAKADLSKHSEAIKNYSKAIELNPQFSYAFNNRGLSYHQTGEYEKAIADFDFALTIKPQDPTLFFNRGLTYYETQRYEKALRDFQTCVTLDAANAEAFNYLGLCFNYLNRFENARTSYDNSIAISPDFSSAYNNRGWVKYLMKDNKGALEDFNKAISLDAQFSFPYHNRGLLMYESNQNEKACEDWATAFSLGYEESGKLIGQYCSGK